MSKYVVTDSGQTDATVDELQKRARKYLRYENISDNLVILLTLFIFGSFILVIYLASWLGVSLPYNWGLLILILDFGISVALAASVVKKKGEYYLNTDEWAKFYTHSILANLRYLGTESRGMKKTYKKEVLKDIKHFLSCIEEKWTVGSFKPAKDFVGTAVADLAKNLRYRVIPAIKGEDKELLKKVTGIMSEFLILSNSLSVEYVKNVNAMMSELPNREPMGKTHISRMFTIMKTHQMVRHSLVVGALGLVSLLTGYIAFNVGVSTDTSWIIGTTIFVFSAGIYITKQHRSEK
jgi:glycosyltransferase involved in cell wall biosynthesis